MKKADKTNNEHEVDNNKEDTTANNHTTDDVENMKLNEDIMSENGEGEGKSKEELMVEEFEEEEKERKDINKKWYVRIREEFNNYINIREQSDVPISIIKFLDEQCDSYPGEDKYDRLKGYLSILISVVFLVSMEDEIFISTLKRRMWELFKGKHADNTTEITDVFELLIHEIIEVHLKEKGKFDEILQFKANSFSLINRKMSYLSYAVEKLSSEKVSIKDMNVFLDELKQNLYSENQELIHQFYKLEAQIKNDGNKFEVLKPELIEIVKQSEESFKVNTAVKAMEPLVHEIIDVKLSSEGKFVNILKNKVAELQEKQLINVFKPLIEQIIEKELDESGRFVTILKGKIARLQEEKMLEVFKPLIEQIIEKELDESGRFVELLRQKLINLSNPDNEEARRQFKDIVESIVQKGTQQVKEVAVATTRLGVTQMSDTELEDTFSRLKDMFKPGQEGLTNRIWQAFRITRQGLSDEAEKFFDGLGFSIYAYQVFPPIPESENIIRPMTVTKIENVSEEYKNMYNKYIEDKIIDLYNNYKKEKENYPKTFNEVYEYEPILIGWLQKDEYGNWRDTDKPLIEEVKNMGTLEDEDDDDEIRVDKIDDLPKFCILFSTRENGWSIMIVTSEPASKRFREEIGLIINPDKKGQKVAIEDIYNKIYFLTRYYQMPKIEIALFNKELNLPLSETQIVATRSGETVLSDRVDYISHKYIDKDSKVYIDRKGKVKGNRHVEIHDTNKKIRNILMRIRNDESPDMIHFSYENFWYVWASKKQTGLPAIREQIDRLTCTSPFLITKIQPGFFQCQVNCASYLSILVLSALYTTNRQLKHLASI